MALSSKIKDVLHGPESEAAARGEVDKHTPGSFPVDDMQPEQQTGSLQSSTGSGRNKLHKSNDPRGWSASDDKTVPRSHRQEDSGVGIMESDKPAAAEEPVEEAYGPTEDFEERQTSQGRGTTQEYAYDSPATREEERTAPGYDEKPTTLGTTAGTTAIPGDAETREESTNVVRTEPTETSEKRVFPLVGGITSREPARDNTTTTTSTTTAATREPERLDESKDSSHWKEGAAGAAVLGGGGAAAYAATRDDKDDDTKGKQEPLERKSTDEKEKKHRSLFGGIFHRGAKDDHKDEKDKEKEKDKQKLTKEQKTTPVVVGGAYQSGDKRTEEEGLQKSQQEHLEDRSVDNKDRGVQSGAAVAAAAAAMGHPRHHDDTVEQKDPTAAPGTTEGNYNVLSSGTTSGVRTGHEPSTSGSRDPTTSEFDDRKDSNRNAAMYGGTAAAVAGVGAGGYAIREARKDRDDDRTGTSRQTETFAREEQRSRRIDDVVPAVSPVERSREPTFDSSTSDYPLGTAAATAGTATAGTAALSSSRQAPQDISTAAGGDAMREPSSEIPRTTEFANTGKYNVLATGTPSGVRIEDNSTTTSAAAAAAPTSTTQRDTDRSKLAGAGLVGAAGAGAGAAALYSRRDDDEREKDPRDRETDTTTKTERTVERTAGVVPGAVGDQSKVMHKCVKCGEDNDISQYFTESRGKKL